MTNHTHKRMDGSQKDNWSDIINTPALFRSEEFLRFQREQGKRTGSDDRKV
jgi:hypothetical protein